MIRFHAPVRSTTLSVYAVVVIVVTLEIQEHIQHDDDDDPTTRNSSYHSWSFPLFPPFFFSSPLLEMIGVATRDTHDGSSRISELDGFNCSWCWPPEDVPHGSSPRQIYVIVTVFMGMIERGINRWNWDLFILIESIFCNCDFLKKFFKISDI